MQLWTTWKRLWIEKRNRLWVVPALHSVGAVVLALAAAWVPLLIPGLKLPHIASETLDNLLTVIASSMLAVTTFSLSIMVSAFASASSSVTPRATELVMGDEGTRTAIANFLSAFMFSIVAQIALGLKYYGTEGRFLLFVGTCMVLIWLMTTLLRWVRTLSSLGRFGNTLERVHSAALGTLVDFWQHPLLHAQPAPNDAQAQALQADPRHTVVRATDVQAVRRLDMPALQALAQEHCCTIHLRVRPGEQVACGDVLAIAVPDAAGAPPAADAPDRKALATALAQHLHLEHERTFDQDPRFGLIVLREAAQRALSDAINDPGSAIACLNSITRALLISQVKACDSDREAASAPETPQYDRLTLVPLEVADFYDDTFAPAIRDGAPFYEIMVRILKLLHLLATRSPRPEMAAHAREQAQFAHACALQQLPYAQDRQALDALYHRLFADGPPAPSAA